MRDYLNLGGIKVERESWWQATFEPQAGRFVDERCHLCGKPGCTGFFAFGPKYEREYEQRRRYCCTWCMKSVMKLVSITKHRGISVALFAFRDGFRLGCSMGKEDVQECLQEPSSVDSELHVNDGNEEIPF